MKLIILLAVATLANGAKLDRNYLPPAHATTSGGSENFLQAPASGHNELSKNDFSRHNRFTVQSNSAYMRSNNNDHDLEQDSNRFTQNSNNFAQHDKFAQHSNDFAQHSNDFTQHSNDFAQHSNDYAQHSDDFDQHSNNFAQHGNDFAQQSHAFENDAAFLSGSNDFNSSPERNALILRQENKNDGDYYSHSYETDNGIIAEESGVAANGVQAQGGYSYVGPDGQVYSVRYTADENGYQAVGDHLPTPPPIPEDILKALQKNALDEANGIFDDGSYNAVKYENIENIHNGHHNGENYNNGANYNSNGGNNGGNNGNDHLNGEQFHKDNSFNINSDDDDSIVTNNALLRSNKGFSRNNFGIEVGKTYLPPNRQHAFNNLPNNDQIANVRSIGNTFAPDSIDKGYLPPRRNIELGQRSQINQYRNSFVRSDKNSQNIYLGPFEGESDVTRASFGQSTNNFDSRGNDLPSRGSQRYQAENGVDREYLPPSHRHVNTRRSTRRVYKF